MSSKYFNKFKAQMESIYEGLEGGAIEILDDKLADLDMKVSDKEYDDLLFNVIDQIIYEVEYSLLDFDDIHNVLNGIVDDVINERES